MIESPALTRWQQRVDQYREQQSRYFPPLWDRNIGWYERWVEGNDYYHKLVSYLAPDIPEGAKILEIGPGTGAITIPLAEAGADILCLEPSKKMAKSLETELNKRRLSNVEILPVKVEDSLNLIQHRAPFQQTLASFSLYNVREIDRVLETLLVCSQRIVILLGTGARSPWYQALIREFAGEEPISAPQLDLLYPLLLDMGILAEGRILPSSQNYLYDSEEEMVNSWQEKLNAPSSRRERLTLALRDLSETRDGKLGIYQSRPLALVTIERQKQIHRQVI